MPTQSSGHGTLRAGLASELPLNLVGAPESHEPGSCHQEQQKSDAK